MSIDRKILGIMLLTVGVLGLGISSFLFAASGYSMWPMGLMMGRGMMWRWDADEVKVITGTVEHIEWMEIELRVGQELVEIHGPLWFWERVGVTEGDIVTAKGVFASMMEPGQGWHEGFMPFELAVNGKTYGDAREGIPVWMQE